MSAQYSGWVENLAVQPERAELFGTFTASGPGLVEIAPASGG